MQKRMTNHKSIKTTVKSWARLLPTVRSVWLFGSWAKNTQTSKSDIDLAVEIDTSVIGSETPLTYWFFESDGMKSELQKMISNPIDFQRYDKTDCPNVYSYVSDHGILIYKKENLQKTEEP